MLAGREKARSSGSDGCTSAQLCSAHAAERDVPMEQTHPQPVPGGAFLPARAHPYPSTASSAVRRTW